MKIAIIADIHANLEALETVLIACESDGVDKYICLGDIVGYGPDPVACIQRLIEVQAIFVAGDHDIAVLNTKDISLFNTLVRPSLFYAAEEIGAEEREYLSKYTTVYFGEGEYSSCVFSHANPSQPTDWEYLVTLQQISKCLDAIDRKVVFVGHTHDAKIYCKIRSDTATLTSLTVAVGSHKYLVNSGSVGQPRDGDPRTAYAIWDSERNNIELKRLEYPIEHTQNKMRNLGFPGYTIDRLATGE